MSGGPGEAALDGGLVILVVKLAGVAAIVFAASKVARRHGHGAGGWVAGLPLIAGTVTGLLLLSQPAPWVRSVAVATLACVPATVLHQCVFAALARRRGPLACSVAANGVFAVAASGLAMSVHGAAWAAGLAVGALILGSAWLAALGSRPIGAPNTPPSSQALPAPSALPGSRAAPTDLPWRIGAAVLLAAVLLVAAERVPPAVGGWLLAVPIVGNVLPVFTLRRSGVAATQALLRGFVAGFGAFVGFFAVLAAGLSPGPLAGLPEVLVFALAVACAPAFGSAFAHLARRVAAPWSRLAAR